jgi:two-component system CheB/CheR fusion protein
MFPMKTPNQSRRCVPLVGVVERDAADRDELANLLHRLGVRAVSFESAEQFLDAMHGDSISCLLVGQSLPGMSGLELLRTLRSIGDEVPFVMFAAETDVSTAVAAIRAGASDCIEKPYTQATVLKRVSRVLQDSTPGAQR